jgi:hypothetical protein
MKTANETLKEEVMTMDLDITEEETTSTNITVIEPEVISQSTGLCVNSHYESESGFLHVVGVRKFGKLKIVELMAGATSVAYLSGVQVYDENDTLIIDRAVEKGVHYSREKVRRIVFKDLFKMLEDGAKKNGQKFDSEQAKNKINDLLNDAYYSESYEAVLNWANDIGIELY